jgi:uroporphyrin-III C-methyltransferase/precorrin-2 dehydrogenase/sirohydrochlorin ferrochelatase/uroporphyrin-III C-methyltransferase
LVNPVYIVGAGPGDPELLTVKAQRILGEADAVVYDRLVSDGILDIIPAGATRIFAGKAARDHHMPQDEINALLVSLAKGGRKVVRLKGGDPFVFGRGSEEAVYLARNGIPFEVVPGITASVGCTAAAGIPLTHRGIARSVRLVSGHQEYGEGLDLDWKCLADPYTTLVIYMGLSNARHIATELMAGGLPAATPAAAIHKGTTPNQRSTITTLDDLADCLEREEFGPPTLLVIGKVVDLAAELGLRPEELESAPKVS